MDIPELKLVSGSYFQDERGFFSETYNYKRYCDMGINSDFVQDNFSLSTKTRTLRGLHFQAPPYAQGKLIRCGRGSIFDVAVDIRLDSPTFGQYKALELSEQNKKQFYIPVGFAHGFMTLEPNTEVLYKCTEYYEPKAEGSLYWNDQSLSIPWPFINNIIINQKDSSAPSLKSLKSPFIYGKNS